MVLGHNLIAISGCKGVIIVFQTRLRELREAAGYKSQQAFADAFGVAQSTVGGWEAGKREPNYKTTMRLASFFKVSVDNLLGLEDKKEQLPAEGEELSDARKKALQFIEGLSDDQLDRFINMGRAALEMGGSQQTQNTPRGEAGG